MRRGRCAGDGAHRRETPATFFLYAYNQYVAHRQTFEIQLHLNGTNLEDTLQQRLNESHGPAAIAAEWLAQPNSKHHPSTSPLLRQQIKSYTHSYLWASHSTAKLFGILIVHAQSCKGRASDDTILNNKSSSHLIHSCCRGSRGLQEEATRPRGRLCWLPCCLCCSYRQQRHPQPPSIRLIIKRCASPPRVRQPPHQARRAQLFRMQRAQCYSIKGLKAKGTRKAAG